MHVTYTPAAPDYSGQLCIAVQIHRHASAGDWEAGQLRDASPDFDDSDDEDIQGDFEDIETGQNFGATGDAVTAAALKAIQEDTSARQEEKAAKKAAFNAEYDVGALLLNGISVVIWPQTVWTCSHISPNFKPTGQQKCILEPSA